LLQDRPQQLGIGHDPGLDQVEAELGVPGAVEVVGQQVVAQHELARHAEGGEHDGRHPAGSVLAAGTVVEQREPARRAQQPQCHAERLPLPPVGHEPAVYPHHERGSLPVAEFSALPLVVAAGGDLVDRPEVTAADRQVHRFDPVGQPVAAAEQDLAGCPEVDDGAQPELIKPFGIGRGELAERVAAEQPPAHDLEATGVPVAADVPHVDRAVELDVP